MGVEAIAGPPAFILYIILGLCLLGAVATILVRGPGRNSSIALMTGVVVVVIAAFVYFALSDRAKEHTLNDLKEHYGLSSILSETSFGGPPSPPLDGEERAVTIIREDGYIWDNAVLRAEDGRVYILVPEEPEASKLIEAPSK